MKRVLWSVGLSLVLSTSTSSAYDIEGNVTTMRVHTESVTNDAVRHYISFQLSGSLVAPCSWLFLTPQDKLGQSILVAAKTANKSIKLSYNSSLGAPWEGASYGTCAVNWIEYQ